MSFDGFWMITLTSPESIDPMQRVLDALTRKPLHPDVKKVLAGWREDGKPELDVSGHPHRDIPWHNDFLVPFVHLTPGPSKLDMDALNASECVNWLSLNRTAPSAVLFYGLGRERALKLPGFYGNMLVRPEAVRKARRLVEAAHEMDRAEFVGRAEKMLSSEGGRVEELLDALPKAFAQAEKKKAGVFALGFGPG